MNNPVLKIKDWLNNEKELGSQNPDRVVLATAGKNGIPHSRVVAIREISDKGILFFSQKRKRKVIELSENPSASMTLWLPLQQREVILDGKVVALSQNENEKYWQTLPRDRQLKFATYAPTSTHSIQSIDELWDTYQNLTQKFENQDIPMNDCYCGFRLIPEEIYFYTLGDENFSELIRFSYQNNEWLEQLLSP